MILEEKIQITQNLQDKIDKLISIYERSVEQNEQLFAEKQLLISSNKEKDLIIEQQKKEIEKLKLGNAIVLSNDNHGDEEQLLEMKHEAKIKINKIVKEIDKSIALLNKLQ